MVNAGFSSNLVPLSKIERASDQWILLQYQYWQLCIRAQLRIGCLVSFLL